jgi:hypothetical protein
MTKIDQWRVGNQKTYTPYDLAGLYSQARDRILHSRVLRDCLDILLADGYAGDEDHLRWLCRGRIVEIAAWAAQIKRDSSQC